jgi:hypothetical protein
MSRRIAVPLVVLVAVALPAGAALAAWTVSSAGSGSSKARSLPAASGNPSAAPTPATNSGTVRVTFTTATFTGATLGYAVNRYAASTGGSSLATTTCSTSPCDIAVPDGTWYFEVAPALQNWRGGATTRVAATVDTTAPTAPTLTTTPASLVATGTTATFAWTGETGASYACAIDSGTAAACTSPKSYSSLGVGSHTFNVQATDAVGNTAQASVAAFTWSVTDFLATDVQAANGSGGSTGRIEAKDKLTFTFSKAVKASTIDSGWDGTGSDKNLDVRVYDGGSGNDYIEIWPHSGSSKVEGFGRIDLGSPSYVTGGGYVVFGDGTSGHGSATTLTGSTVSIALDTAHPASGAQLSTTAVGVATMVWTPGTSFTDTTGHPIVVSPVTEGGTADVDF